MKKNWIIVLALLMVMATLCTACGGSGGKQEAEPTEAPAEATELPSVTAPPAEGTTEEAGLAAEENTAPEQLDRDSWLASLSEEQRMVEEELVGALVEDLYAAIGEPISAEYTTSCLVADGEDGVLTYDNFLVATTRFANGAEYVMGTESK